MERDRAETKPGRIYWGAISLVPIGLGVVIGLILLVMNNYQYSQAAAKPAPKPAPIDGERAYGYLKTICAIGPRIAGSAANTRQRELVKAHFEKCGATVRDEAFTASHPRDGTPVPMVNLVGSWNPDRFERVLIAAHYDTRPYPDQDPNPAKRRDPFIGANDGASGTAMLMELANHLKDWPTPWGVDLVLLDGEELVYQDGDEYFLGSKEFGRAYKERRARDPKSPRYVAGIVLDMIGDRNLQIAREPNSVELAPALVRDVWGVAASLRSRVFVNDFGRRVLDDHLPLNEAGIPTIDIIDFDYPRWHTTGDVPEACSGASLAQVGRVLTSWLAVPKPAPRTRRR